MGRAKRKNDFGDYFKQLRIATGMTLRKFCHTHGLDASNMSKMERGLLPPPPYETLKRYAKCLGIKKESNAWFTLFDLAAVGRREIPADFLSDEELMAKLPLIFRTVRGEKVPRDQLDDLIRLVRES